MVILIVILLAVLLLLPYGMAAYHQHRLTVRLRRRGAENGYRFLWLRGAPHLPRNLSRSYDFCMVKGDTVYAVKLFAAYRKGRVLVLGGDGRLGIRSARKSPLEVKASGSRKTKKRVERIFSVPRTRLPEQLFKEKQIHRIFLTYPVFDAVVRRDRGEEVPLSVGDGIFDKQLHTPTSFENELLKKSEVS